METTRVCRKCNVEQPIEKFSFNNHKKDTRRRVCHSCRCKPRSPELRKEDNLRKKYGLTLSDFEEMKSAQNGQCAICFTDKPSGKYGDFHVDHCHSTGEVRGLLCYKCNSVLGLVGDNIQTLQNAIHYLNKHG